MARSSSHIRMPDEGQRLRVENGRLQVPDQPILGYIEGDGIGPDITRACLRVWDAAVAKAYGDRRRIHWCEIFLGEKAASIYDGAVFPEMRVGPDTYPNWRTHEGCFRCHGVLVSKKDGHVISQDCNLCHTLPASPG